MMSVRLTRSRLESLMLRMRIAFDRRFLLEYLKHQRVELLGSAYFRDMILGSLLNIRQVIALGRGDRNEADRVAKLGNFWDRSDKGRLASKRVEREALILLRRLYMHEMFPARNHKQREQEEAELSRSLLDAAKNAECQFELALAKAKQFRRKRGAARITEEGSLRADLAWCGVTGQLIGETFPDSDTMMELFDPFRHAALAKLKASKKELDRTNADNIERNWRKLLDECHVTPRRRKKTGRPRKVGTGGFAKIPFFDVAEESISRHAADVREVQARPEKTDGRRLGKSNRNTRALAPVLDTCAGKRS